MYTASGVKMKDRSELDPAMERATTPRRAGKSNEPDPDAADAAAPKAVPPLSVMENVAVSEAALAAAALTAASATGEFGRGAGTAAARPGETRAPPEVITSSTASASSASAVRDGPALRFNCPRSHMAS